MIRRNRQRRLAIFGGELNKKLVHIGWAFSAFAVIGTILLTAGCDPVEYGPTSLEMQELSFTVSHDVSLTVEFDGGTSVHKFIAGSAGFHALHRGAFDVVICGEPSDIDHVCELSGLEVNEASLPRDIANVDGMACISIASGTAVESQVNLARCN